MSFELNFSEWAPSAGSLSYAPIPWDAEVLGHPVYELRIADDETDAGAHLPGLLTHLRGMRTPALVYTKVSMNTPRISALTGNGFYPVETTLRPTRSLQDFDDSPAFEGLALRDARDEDHDHLVKLARSAFSTDRYHVDPNIPAAAADERFERWLRRGLEGEDLIWTYEKSSDASVVGFVLLRDLGDGRVDFSLAAVEPGLQRLGFGTMLYSACLVECKRRAFKEMVTLISTNNIGVLNIYARLGFSFYDPRITLHWFADG